MAKRLLTSGKAIFIVDLILIPVFIAVIITGLKLHAAGHGISWDTREFWAHLHIIVCAVSLLTVSLHAKAHWKWYKSLAKNGLAKKDKTTFTISLLFLALTVTGIILLFSACRANTGAGLWHYALGLLTAVLLILHLSKRYPPLIKGLRRKKQFNPSTSRIRQSQRRPSARLPSQGLP